MRCKGERLPVLWFKIASTTSGGAISHRAMLVEKVRRRSCSVQSAVPDMRSSAALFLLQAYISADYITLPKEITKNSSEHVLPNLIGENLKLIPRTSDYVLPSTVGTP